VGGHHWRIQPDPPCPSRPAPACLRSQRRCGGGRLSCRCCRSGPTPCLQLEQERQLRQQAMVQRVERPQPGQQQQQQQQQQWPVQNRFQRALCGRPCLSQSCWQLCSRSRRRQCSASGERLLLREGPCGAGQAGQCVGTPCPWSSARAPSSQPAQPIKPPLRPSDPTSCLPSSPPTHSPTPSARLTCRGMRPGLVFGFDDPARTAAFDEQWAAITRDHLYWCCAAEDWKYSSFPYHKPRPLASEWLAVSRPAAVSGRWQAARMARWVGRRG